MHIREFSVKNFRAISSVKLSNLGEVVIIAGPNGCGKSCILDAIRLLKSVYGGYSQNEWQNWFGEFQINFHGRQSELLSLFQDKSSPLEISGKFVLTEDEKSYLLENVKELLTDQIWREVSPETANLRSAREIALAANLRTHSSVVDSRVNEALPVLLHEIRKGILSGSLRIQTDGKAVTTPSRLLELIFSTYDPQNIGIIDYHGANRNYNREQVGGINLNIESSEEQLRQHALYNYTNKYHNLKTEMASSFIRQLISQESGNQKDKTDSLTETLKELFTTFFPGKEFLGPQPTASGVILFPVRTPSGSSHDINDLSSGEKEVLYGYLRLRNSAPRNSVLLLDEPELHLNPRLIRGLAGFYHKHLSKALNNQLWMITHSDTLIRETVGKESFRVFHMQPAGSPPLPNQVIEVSAQKDIEQIVIDLVGDLAAYRPGAKIVIFEGGGDTDFDVRMVSSLFPEFSAIVNPISAGNKQRVAELYSLLDKAKDAGSLPVRFYSINDSDGELPAPSKNTGPTFTWNVYHIENYLLEPKFIHKVLSDVNLATKSVSSPDCIESELLSCAKETISSLVLHQIKARINSTLLSFIDINIDPKSSPLAPAFLEAAERAKNKITNSFTSTLSLTELASLERLTIENLNTALEDGSWKTKFRGRDILKRFIGRHGSGMKYEPFRDLIIARMKDAGHQPDGMKIIINKIMEEKI
ncbi:MULTISPECIES: AAA family ATPase [Pseudomonas]|uniref:AAA family ATPase n=1 Tax=Pseudomonas TaxID=286 RepID=UPI002E266F29|nr:AAA family ATPase [Pseudomonas sp. JH-2]